VCGCVCLCGVCGGIGCVCAHVCVSVGVCGCLVAVGVCVGVGHLVCVGMCVGVCGVGFVVWVVWVV